jgi:nitrite reductase/ring-hydroxylating ferredoxin subunit
MLMGMAEKEFALAGSLEKLKAQGRLVMHGGHRPTLVTYDQGRVFAFDNRCPHASDDRLLYTFTLRRGFHDGGDVIARDVIASLKRMFVRDSQNQILAGLIEEY